MSPQAVAQQIEQWPLARFIHYVRNPRKNDHAVDRMAASISEFGFKVPVLAKSSGDVIDGHLRLKAAQKLAMSEIPVIVCDDWSDAQVKAFRL
jgi:ParB-like chromosome segregation protein Spo0J